MNASTLLRSTKNISVKAFALLKKNDPLILASATAFFATFSISPIIVILVSALGLCFKSDTIRYQLFDSIQTTLGQKATSEIESIVNNFISLEGNVWVTIGVLLFLLFVATTLLGIIRKAIHQVWNIRKKSTLNFRYNVKERLIGLVMLIFMGILFLFSLVLDASVIAFRDFTQDIIPGIDSTLIRLVNITLSVVIVTIWFTILFKILPEAHVQWKVAFAGGLITSVLFNIGKFILGLILQESRLESIFNTSASITLILLFIFYSSLIMYYGAAFTHAFAEETGTPIHPGKYADEYEERLIEEMKNKQSTLTTLAKGNPNQNKNKDSTQAATS